MRTQGTTGTEPAGSTGQSESGTAFLQRRLRVLYAVLAGFCWVGTAAHLAVTSLVPLTRTLYSTVTAISLVALTATATLCWWLARPAVPRPLPLLRGIELVRGSRLARPTERGRSRRSRLGVGQVPHALGQRLRTPERVAHRRRWRILPG
jgi:hypothetical protein